jgi:hypothetical protein
VNRKKVFSIVAVGLLLPILCPLLTYRFFLNNFILYRTAPWYDWALLPAPPEVPTQFLDVSEGWVVVEAESGRTYGCANPCLEWQEASPPFYQFAIDCTPQFLPPENVIASTNACGHPFGYAYHYIITEDGNVYRYAQAIVGDVNPGELMLHYLFKAGVVFSAIIGLLAAVIISWQIWRR